MGKFDEEYDKIKDLRYNPDLNAYTNEDESIVFRNVPFSDGTGYKRDLYEGDLQGKHSAEHMKVDLSGNWTLDTHDEEKSDEGNTSSSGSGCYLTTACLKHLAEHFQDDCYELTTLRWFRDNFVKPDDISMYYRIAPLVVERINLLSEEKQNAIYNDIYLNVISPCVKFIEQKKYESAYKKYKESVLELKTKFLPSFT